MGSQWKLTFWAFYFLFLSWNLFSIVLVGKQVIIITSDFFYISMTSIILVLLFLRFKVKIIDVLSNYRNSFTSSTKNFSQFINKNMNLIGFKSCCHFVYFFYPFPYTFRMFIIESFCDKGFRFNLLVFPFKLFRVKTVYSSESRYSAWSWNSSPCHDQNIIVLHHIFYYVLGWLLNWKMLVLFSLYFSW